MGLRPGQAKGPWVGISGSGSGSGEIKISSNDTTAGYAEDKLLEGQAQEISVLNEAGNEALEFADGIAGFRDDFTTAKPFWDGNDAITSGHWEIDLVNEYLEGIAGSGADEDTLRYGIEGDYDYAIEITPNSGVSSGLIIESGDGTVKLELECESTLTNIIWYVTGKSNTTVSAPSSRYWIRQMRRGKTVYAFYRDDSDDPWTLIGSFSDVDPGYDAKLKIDSAIGTYIHEMILYDNMFPQRVRSNESKQFVPLTDGATINIDARKGNKFSVTLGGNRTIANPTSMLPEQMLLIAITQDGTGTRTVTWGGDFRFSGGTTPTLTTTGGKTDYFGFIYNTNASKWDCIAQSLNH